MAELGYAASKSQIHRPNLQDILADHPATIGMLLKLVLNNLVFSSGLELRGWCVNAESTTAGKFETVSQTCR